MSAFDLLVDCIKDATKERDELAAALEQAQADAKFLREWIDSLLAESGPIHGAHNELRRYFLHVGISTDATMEAARQLLESAIDGTFDGMPQSAGDQGNG